MRRLRDALRWLAVGTIAVGLGTGAAVAIAGGRPAGPNLRVSALSGVPATVGAGGSFTVKVAVVNRGTRRGAATRTRFWLSRDARLDRADLPLRADLAVPRLGPRKRRSGSLRLLVPSGTPAGSYRLLACADGGGLLRETNESDNCRASRSSLTVTRTEGSAVPGPVSTAPPAPVTTTTTTSTTTTTTTTPPCGTADADADGIPDCADPCPNAPSASGYCPQTIYDIADGVATTGAKVEVADALVTGIAPNGLTAWLAVKATDAGYTRPQYSGLEVDLTALSPAPAVTVGERVTIRGTVSGAHRVALDALTVTQSLGEQVTPVELTPTALISGAALYAAVLVHVTGDTPYTLSAVGVGGWTMTTSVALTSFRVGPRAIGTLPAKATGTVYSSLTGFADVSGLDPVLLPRTAADIVET